MAAYDPLYGPNGEPILASMPPNLNATQDSNNYGTNNNNIPSLNNLNELVTTIQNNSSNNSGNLNTAINNEPVSTNNEPITTTPSYTNLDATLSPGFDPSKLSKPDLIKFQNDLQNAGFDLPQFGADGSMGAETQNAWDQFYKSKQPGITENGEDSLLSLAAGNEADDYMAESPIDENKVAIDQNAESTINESADEITAATNNSTQGNKTDTSGEDPNAVKRDLVQSYFSNMDFGEYSNPFSR